MSRPLPGVAAADGSVGGFAQVIDPQTDEVISGGGAPTIGSSWDPDVTPFELTGEPPQAENEVVIDADTVDEAGLEIGDEVRIVTPLGVDPYRLTGVIALPSATTIGGATVASFELDDRATPLRPRRDVRPDLHRGGGRRVGGVGRRAGPGGAPLRLPGDHGDRRRRRADGAGS